ncbi:hypothetical protein DFJ58DRAFT_845058 [Suillus subalutaceus]|uniref:uncharacterized protein n=1 Tax=Suillus subalutaceus TaxID=48586 RepID=UPI001B886915|nr:uncharacterized protein DFJ58DRAFT_845058 [Suillus subalutaceus]KAG1841331.1 hypothetical protein DFJ58DRAFT_845058 [Suillus subalutaceus]
MDELVHHCLRELSFDGDLGCNVSRLRDFIVGFYSHDATHPQVVDDAFCAFVWSIVVQQPTVRVGTVPVGVSSEVYIAPQTSAKRKAAAKGEEYGEDLRIAVDPETSFAAITGSHIRSSKLSPMVYSALQLITRGREEGITTVELGRKTKYDQKTCFYVIKQLLELDLMVASKHGEGGVGNHSCIHKYFVERSAFWQQIQQEETKTTSLLLLERVIRKMQPLLKMGLPLLHHRNSTLSLWIPDICLLLKASQNNMHASNNLIITIGFANPTKTDRRFFQTRLRELIAQGVIERVLVPSSKVKDRLVKCIRLVAPDNQLPEGGVILAPQEAGHTEVRANRTIQKQVSDVLEEAGSSGRTLHEICSALGNFDKRTIELLLTRAAKSRPPAHLSDLGTADFMESFGRERRHRYYTLAAYTTVMASEKLGDTTTSYVDIDVSKAGDFAVFHEAMFYDDDETLHYYEDMFKDKEDAKKPKIQEMTKRFEDTPEPVPKAKRGRPPKKPRGEEDGDISIPPKKRGRPRKNPIAEEGDGTSTDVNVIVLPAQVPSAPPSETSGHPPESPASSVMVQEPMDYSFMDNHPSAQESMIIDPVLLGTSPLMEADVMPTVIGEKRKGSPPLVTPSQPKRTRTSTPVITQNKSEHISFTPRENEFFRVIQDLGGIANLHTKHFFDAHMALLNDMAQRGEPASAPSGTRIDKRTADATIKNMESRGRIKVLKTTTFQEPVDFGASSSVSQCTTLPLHLLQIEKSGKDDDEHQVLDAAKAEELFAYDSETICDVLLTERTTLDVPIAIYCSFIAVLTYDEELSKLIASVESRENTGQRPAEPYFSKAAVALKAASFDGWRVSAPSAAPQYWRFNENSTVTSMGSFEFFPALLEASFGDELHKVSRDVAYARSTVCPTHGTLGPPANTPLLRFLRRRVSWDLEYRLTWHQKRYLDQSVDSATAHSPLDEEDSDLQLQQICHVLSAPRAPVVAYLKDAAERVLREIKKARARQKRDEAEALYDANIEAKNHASKEGQRSEASEGKRLGSFASAPQSEIRIDGKVKLKTPSERLDWLPNKVIARPKALAVPRIALPPVAANPPEEIDQSENKTSRQRRSRFHWTREYDELARDASAIIRARCRGGVKIDLSAFDQVFPAVPRNSVRLRLSHLRENTGEEVYMRRLEDRWHELWVQHRGTEHLPDEDPQSPSNFDIMLTTIRRVGYVEHTTRTKLPASVDDIIHRFDVLCNTTISPAWEFVWQATVEEGREKQFLRQSFTHGADEVPYVTNISDDVVQVAEAALKVAVMVFGMSTEHYDADLAAELLHSAGDQSVSLATSNLLRRGVLSRVVRDPKKMKPGRTLKISDVNLNAIGGLIHGDLFQDAVALDEVFAEQVGILEWPLLASDGDTAALLQLVSEEQIRHSCETLEQGLTGTAKKQRIDDDDIETSIQVRLNAVDNGDDNEGNGGAMLPSYESRLDPTNTPLDESMQREHGKTVTGTDAACAKKTQSKIVNCVLCTESTFSEFIAGLDCEQRKLAQDIFDRANASSESGSSKSHYLAFGAGDVVMDLLQRMSQTSPPLILWVGYSAPVIVSCLHARSWTVEIIREPKALALPRRWLDIRGETIQETWDAALHAVVFSDRAAVEA